MAECKNVLRIVNINKNHCSEGLFIQKQTWFKQLLKLLELLFSLMVKAYAWAYA